MYQPAEALIHPDNRNLLHRVFVFDDVEHERLRTLASSVMDVYASVTGKQYGYSDTHDYPDHIITRLTEDRRFELRFGMPKLHNPARDNGKLRGSAGNLLLAERRLHIAMFYVDTNDFDFQHPQPDASREVVTEFNSGLRELADTEFGDMSIPAPRTATTLGYDITVPPREFQ